MAAIYQAIESTDMLVVLAVLTLLVGFWAWMLVDCIWNKDLKPAEKTAWFLVIFFCPLAALIYSLLLRKRKMALLSD